MPTYDAQPELLPSPKRVALLERIARSAQNCRRLQKRYFTKRTQEHLETAKLAEHALDKLLSQFFDPPLV